MTFLTADAVSGLNFIKGRIRQIHVPGIHLLLAQAQAFAEALEVNNLPLSQEADNIIHIGIVG